MDAPISDVSTPDLIDRITELAGHLNAANARFLALIAEFDRRRGWAEWGVKSCAHWLNWKCGIALGAAREKLRTAHALAGLPRIAEAMAEGRLSFSKVRAMTRVADESNEDYFLNVALNGTATHVEKLVRSYRRAQESLELSRAAQQQRNQTLWWFHESDGSLSIKGRLPAEVGALFIKAIQAAEDAIPAQKDVPAETFSDACLTAGARRVEALGRMAESFLANGSAELAGSDRQQIVVHVGAETLKHDHAGRCELEAGPSLAAETARRLACDASVIRILENERGEPLNVGRKTRTIPPAIRRALNSRDRGCRFPGCTFTRYVDGHHVKHWAKGGETKLSNLVTLCRFHHRQVHEGRVVVSCLDDGAFRFTRPDGKTFENSLPPATTWDKLVADQQIQITPQTAITGWTREELDVELAVDWLLRRGERVNNVTAETSI
ncbi:MAG: HNH endonuclease [Pseudomonadota bacterium]|nr:HNH endonuclease [Pseudomonadota bacterium]